MKAIVTSRLKLMEVEEQDTGFILNLVNSPGWLRFIGDRGIYTAEEAKIYITESLIRSYKELGYGLYKMVLQSTLEPIGICGLVKRPNLDQPDLGFAILPDYERLGFTSEAGQAILSYSKQLGIPKVYAITKDGNLGSIRVLTKLGFQSDGAYTDRMTEEALLRFSFYH